MTEGMGWRFKYFGYLFTLVWVHTIGGVFGETHSINPRLLNVLAGSLVSVFICHLGLVVGYSRRVARSAAYFVGLFPVMVFHNALILRDTKVTNEGVMDLQQALPNCDIRR